MPDFGIKPSDVKQPLFSTVWRNSERETIATNILKLARFANGDEWKPFTWEDYVKFCSHNPTPMEHAILNEFAENGYLSKKDASEIYSFTRKIIGVYMQYCD